MYIGEIELGNNATLDIQVADGYGQPSDADGSVAYAIYEGVTDMGISGTLSKIGTETGFYGGQIDITEANGFEAGKDYTARLSLDVNGSTVKKLRTFRVTEKSNQLSDIASSLESVLRSQQLISSVLKIKKKLSNTINNLKNR